MASLCLGPILYSKLLNKIGHDLDIIYKASKTIFRLYAKEKNYGSFWVGVKKQDGSWFKTSGEILNKVEVDVINDWSDGDCMIVDAENDYRHKVVGCDLKYKVFI